MMSKQHKHVCLELLEKDVPLLQDAEDKPAHAPFEDRGLQPGQEIILPPTISVTNNSVDPGQTIEVLGYGVPGQIVEVWFYPVMSGQLPDELIYKQEITALNDGKWTAFINTTGFDNGKYKIKARINYETVGISDFSLIMDAAVGEEVVDEVCSGADLNKDGRVNITDFSILLYYWNTDDECADQNKDGNVDLIDFSIMMFYWTG